MSTGSDPLDVALLYYYYYYRASIFILQMGKLRQTSLSNLCKTMQLKWWPQSWNSTRSGWLRVWPFTHHLAPQISFSYGRMEDYGDFNKCRTRKHSSIGRNLAKGEYLGGKECFEARLVLNLDSSTYSLGDPGQMTSLGLCVFFYLHNGNYGGSYHGGLLRLNEITCVGYLAQCLDTVNAQ